MDQIGKIRTFALVPKRNDRSLKVAEKIKESLTSAGLAEDPAAPDVVIVVGGDGSLLFAVQEYLDMLGSVAFVGVHTGTLGFFMDYTEGDIDVLARDLTAENLPVKHFPLLTAVVGDQKFYAVNEVRLENPLRTQDVSVHLNGAKFEDLRSSGLCISTQLGSTAYNRSLGGAILQEDLPTLILTEIAGIHHQKYRSVRNPFVMSEDTEIVLKSSDFEGCFLCADAAGVPLNGGGEVVVKKSTSKSLRILRLREVSHFERLRRLF